MTEPSIVDADIERCAEAMYEDEERSTPGGWYKPWAEVDKHTWRLFRDRAEAALKTIAAAGRLLPEPAETRCPNCDHKVGTHGAGGCWFTLKETSIGENLVCGCELIGPWVPVPDPQEGSK